jgi:hypothetical protein
MRYRRTLSFPSFLQAAENCDLYQRATLEAVGNLRFVFGYDLSGHKQTQNTKALAPAMAQFAQGAGPGTS